MTRPRILILGGSGEGFSLADKLSRDSKFEIISSLAGRTPAPKVPQGAVRRGGFGGVGGLEQFLISEKIAAVIDATHPFAEQISENAHQASKAAAVPCIHIWREPWVEVDGDNWTSVDTVEAASETIPEGAKGVFLTTGKTELGAFAGRDDVEFIARIVAPLSADEDLLPKPSKLTFIYDKGPFGLANEVALLKRYEIEWIVTKNSGGSAAYAKLEAARTLGLPVIIVRRPGRPEGLTVETVDEAVRWLQTLALHEEKNSETQIP